VHLQQPYIIAGLINERKDVPKAMGMLATAIAVGGFGGSIIAGILTDMGLLKVAILMPAVPGSTTYSWSCTDWYEYAKC
jgi:hypothetical protein